MNEFLVPFEAMLDGLFPLARVRAIDGGADWSAERAAFDDSGFADALVPEGAGGAGLSFSHVSELWRAIGYRAAPIDLGEGMIDKAGGERATGRALMLAAIISGAADRVLEMTIAYARERSQFGKVIGAQQAIQQQLALMAEQVLAIRFAVRQGASGDGWPTVQSAALAKSVASAYAPMVANTAHAIHGAIGISAEYDLQLLSRRLHAGRLDGGGETLWSAKLGRALLSADGSPLDWTISTLFARDE